MSIDHPPVAPASLDLLDVAGNGHDCERFLWIRALSDPELPRKARIDLLDDLQRLPGELLFLASTDGTLAMTTVTARDDTGAGSCSLGLMTRRDPGEPVLGDAVAFALGRARACGVADVRCVQPMDRPFMQPLVDRHGFTEHERWRRFHVELAEHRDERVEELPAGYPNTTLADRGELAAEAFRVYREGLADTSGDFPRPDEQLETWLRQVDGSPVLGRDLLFLLLDADDRVLASYQLQRAAAGSERAWVEFLVVDRDHRGRGLAATLKQHASPLAARAGITRLQSVNHEANAAMIRVNERLGWVEDPVQVALHLPVSG
jgi:GNAT superfamily N-acetyltransferase